MPISPVGTVLKYDVDPTAAAPATTLANVTAFNMDGDEVSIYEIVAMGDASSTKIAGRKTPGTISLSGYYDGAADATSFETLFNNLTGAEAAYRLDFGGTNGTLTGKGIVSSTPSVTVGSDGPVEWSCTIERTNLWVLAEG